MGTGVTLTYFGLIFAAYGATQEYERVKLKLIPSTLVVYFSLTAILFYLFSFSETRIAVYQGSIFYIPLIEVTYPLFWKFKDLILLSINIFIAIISVKYFTNLTRFNQKKFLSLLKHLSKQESYEILNKLHNDNFEKILSLQNKYSSKEATINEIVGFIDLESSIKMNDLRGFEKLKILRAKSDKKFEEFSKEYLRKIFQNRDSFIVRQFLVESTNNEYKKFLFENSAEIELNVNIGCAILELLKNDEELKKVLLNKYNGGDKQVKYITQLLNAWKDEKNRDNNISNLHITLKKELLKYSKLDEEIETNGFFLLKELYKNTVCFTENNYKDKELLLECIDGLYECFKPQGEGKNILDSKKIEIGCYYIEFIFHSDESDEKKDKLKHFSKFIRENRDLKEMFRLVLKNEDRTLCKDKKAFTNLSTKNTDEWNKLEEILGIEHKEDK